MGVCLSVGHGHHHHHDQYVTDDDEDEDGFCTPEGVSSQGESHNPSGRYSFEFPTPPRISADVGDLGALGSLFCKRGNRSRSRDNNNTAVVSNCVTTLDMFLGGANARNRVHHVNQLCAGDYSFASYLASPLLKGFDVHAMEAVAKSYAESAAKAAARDAFVFLEENDISMVSTSSSAYHDTQGGRNVFDPSGAGGEECGDADDDLAKSVSAGDSEEWEELKKPSKAANLWVQHIPTEEGITETFNIFTHSKWEEPKPRKVGNLSEQQNQHEEVVAEITDKFTTSQWEEPKKPSKAENLLVRQNKHEEASSDTTDKFTTSQWEEPKKPRKVENLWVKQNQNIEEAIDKTINKFNNNKTSSNFSFWVSDNDERGTNERGTNERWVSVLNSIQARAKARRRQRRKSSSVRAHGAGTPERVQRCGSVGKAYSGGALERVQRCGSAGKTYGGGTLERFQRCGSIGKAPGAGAPEIIQILQRWGSLGRAHGAGAPEIIQRLQRWGSIGKTHSAGASERIQRCGSTGKAHGTGGAPERVQRCGSSGRKKTVRFSSDTRCPPNSPAELLAPHPPAPEDSPTLEDFSAIGREVWEKVKHSPSLTKFEYKKLCELSSEILREADMLNRAAKV